MNIRSTSAKAPGTTKGAFIPKFDKAPWSEKEDQITTSLQEDRIFVKSFGGGVALATVAAGIQLVGDLNLPGLPRAVTTALTAGLGFAVGAGLGYEMGKSFEEENAKPEWARGVTFGHYEPSHCDHHHCCHETDPLALIFAPTETPFLVFSER
jgi:hypothetical protein